MEVMHLSQALRIQIIQPYPQRILNFLGTSQDLEVKGQ